MPAISKSKLEMEPDGFWKETRAVHILVGHGMHQTTGCKTSVPPNQMPPAPKEDASQKLMYPGLLAMSSQQWDRREATMQRRMPKSLKAEHSALLDWIGSQCLVVLSVASMGPTRPPLAGIPMQVCCSLPWRHSRSLWGTFFVSAGFVVQIVGIHASLLGAQSSV